MRKIRLLILFTFPLFLFFGCSVSTDFYVQNVTDKKARFLIKYKIPIKDWPEYRILKLPYINELIAPKEFSKNHHLSFLNFEQINDSIIAMNIPEKSTVRIEATSNSGFYHYINSFEVNGKSITLENAILISKRKGPHCIFKILENE